MHYIADLHIHSKYSRAVSKDMDLEHLDAMAEIKGIDLIATGDFTHPAWFKELETKLVLQPNGFYKLRGSKTKTQFILSTEVSCIYKKNDKYRRIHLVIICSNLDRIKKINEILSNQGYNLKSDGRPILGLDVKELAKIYLAHDPECIIFPAHIWTPWFSLFGSKSGFDKFTDCFEEISDKISAIETGLSSDPVMNWRIKDLNSKMIISNSDAHSPKNIGREANVFEFSKLSYQNLASAIKQNKNLAYTIEFYPEEGMYHYDGHANCKVRCTPAETLKYKGLCPKCGKKITVGVFSRVEQLKDQDPELQRKVRPPFKSLVPLKEIIAEALDLGVGTKGVEKEYQLILKPGGSEFNILLNLDLATLNKITLPQIAEGIKRVREGKLIIEPGYDGVYGMVKIFSQAEKDKFIPRQTSLF